MERLLGLYFCSQCKKFAKKSKYSKRCSKCANKGKRNPMYGSHPNHKGKNNPLFRVHRFGKDSPHYGKKHSIETKQLMSKNHWSKTQNEAFRKHLIKNRPNNPTKYEKSFYRKIVNKGLIPKPQHKVGTYCCDFYFKSFNLIVEIDGYKKSETRKSYIRNQGYKLLHIKNSELKHFNRVFDKIKGLINEDRIRKSHMDREISSTKI